MARVLHRTIDRALPALPLSTTPRFTRHSFTNPAGTRAYWLYVPGSHDPRRPCALLVMLHGCQQTPEDFAAGTRMNELAEQHGFVVAYPAQSSQANRMRCWNWYRPGDQRPDGGEPSIIAGITFEIQRTHAIDPRRIYVAGLSAGASMAAIMGATYPALYAAVGAHSGMPFGSADNLWAAMSAMRTGRAQPARLPWPVLRPRAGAEPTDMVPTIVFHGSDDRTVHPHNGLAMIRQARTREVKHGRGRMRASMHRGNPAGRHAYTRTRYEDADGHPALEHWVVHGGGHGWSGGSEHGSYTDPHGPDASAEMVRFFSAYPRPVGVRLAASRVRTWVRRVARSWRKRLGRPARQAG